MKNNFGAWLQGQLDTRNWKQADLARASGLTTAGIAQFINNQVVPGRRGCEKIAKAFGASPEIVFRAAGILPPDPAADPLTEQILHIARQLPPEDVQELIDLAQIKLTRHERTQNAARKS